MHRETKDELTSVCRCRNRDKKKKKNTPEGCHTDCSMTRETGCCRNTWQSFNEGIKFCASVPTT